MKKNQTSATAHIILETRWPNELELYKIKLMVTHQRKQKFYSIIIPGMPSKFSIADFEKIKSDKPRKPFSDYKHLISLNEINATEVITNLVDFSFEAFEKKYFESSLEEKSLVAAFETYISELKSQGSVGTASSYKCALVSLKKFTTE